MDRTEKAKEVMQRAERLGFKFDFDRGFIRVAQPRSGDPERQEAIIGELGKYIPEVRRLVERRANAERAKDFFGRRVVFQDGFNLTPGGEGVLSGVLTGASGNGSVDVSIKKEGFRSPHTSSCNVESLLIIVDEEEADGAASPHNDEPQSEQPRKGFFERLRGSRDE